MSILRPILRRVRASMLAAFASYLNRPVRRPDPALSMELLSLASVLRNGDVLLTEGNTRAAALVKRLTRSAWSHVALYVGPLEGGPNPRCIVEADVAAGVRSIRLSDLDAANVRVLRPVGLDEADRGRLAEWVVGRIGGEYDLEHAWRLARSLLPALPKASLQPTTAGRAESATRFICSTLLAYAFAMVGIPIAPGRPALATVATDYRCVIPGDFAAASGFEDVVRPAVSASTAR